MSGFDYFKMAFEKYSDFKGRSRRKEYWYFALFSIILSFVILMLSAFSEWLISLTIVYGLAVIIPTLAVTVRRLHDTGKSGWFYFIGLIPIVGPIVVLVWMCTDSEPGTNEWGHNPKEEGDDVLDHLIAEKDLV